MTKKTDDASTYVKVFSTPRKENLSQSSFPWIERGDDLFIDQIFELINVRVFLRLSTPTAQTRTDLKKEKSNDLRPDC